MTILKWKNPSIVGQKTNNSAVFNSPISGMIDNILGDAIFTREFASYVPAVNFSESKECYYIDLFAPGFEKDEFKIALNKGTLIVSGNHNAEKALIEKQYSHKEFNFGSFKRIFTLPDGINEKDIQAKYENGILNISLLKVEHTKDDVLEIKIL
jgi:HSP20 family protein